MAFDARTQSLLREKDNLIVELKDRLRNTNGSSR
jgi:hypothetical protein